MSYTEKQIARYHRCTKRFTEILALKTAPPLSILAEEGALILETMIAIAGPEVMLCHARNALQRSLTLDGLCPWRHEDDRSLHRIVRDGMCAECLAENPEGAK